MKQSVYNLSAKAFHPHYTGAIRPDRKTTTQIRLETSSFLYAQDVLRRKLRSVNVLLISGKDK